MRHRFALLVALAGLAFATGAAARDCRRHALDALHDAPDGAAVYARLSDKTFFQHWIDCDDPTLGLPTAIHESVHFITSETDAFPLVGGGEVQRPHEVSHFYAPSRIAGSFDASEYADTYLKPGRASSSKDFLFLLDELNAYTHDLNAAVDLKGMRRADRYTDSRDGLAALMAFVALYVEHARASEPATWEGLHEPAVALTMTMLGTRGTGYRRVVRHPEFWNAGQGVSAPGIWAERAGGAGGRDRSSAGDTRRMSEGVRRGYDGSFGGL